MSIDNLQIPDLILYIYAIGVFQLSYLPYRGQRGFRSMQEQLIGHKIRAKFSYNL
jgi:hypothetical protein